MKVKQQKEKDRDKGSMSGRTPKSSVDRRFPLIARMSSWESECIQMLVNQREDAWSIAALIARLSARSGEEMRSLKQFPRLSSFFVWSVRIQAIPASVKHNIVSVGGLVERHVGVVGIVLGGGTRVCASSHSLAAAIAWDIVGAGLIDLFSKSRRFSNRK